MTKVKLEKIFAPQNMSILSESSLDFAKYVVDTVGGTIMGYHSSDNPTALVGRSTHGHEFAVVGTLTGFIVDLWLREVGGVSSQVVFDVEDNDDMDLILEYYGDPATWRELPLTECICSTLVESMTDDAIEDRAERAYNYAENIIKGRVSPELETAIAQSGLASLKYARWILHDRFIEGEPAIFKPRNIRIDYIRYEYLHYLQTLGYSKEFLDSLEAKYPI